MLAETDTLALAPGVFVSKRQSTDTDTGQLTDTERLTDTVQLTDTVRGAAWPLNASGAFVLSRSGSPVGEIVRDLAERFSLPLEAARGDVLRFAWYLNGLALVNLERGGPRLRRMLDWLVLALRLVPTGALPHAVARRRAVDTRSTGVAFVTSLRAILPRVLVLASLATAVALHCAALAAAPGLAAPLALGLGTGLGLGLHEAAHVVSLRGVPCALVMRGRRTYVLHATVGATRRAIVAVAGPLTVAALGLALVSAGAALAAPTLTLAGCPLAAHAFALTVVGGDGRTACGL